MEKNKYSVVSPVLFYSWRMYQSLNVYQNIRRDIGIIDISRYDLTKFHDQTLLQLEKQNGEEDNMSSEVTN